MPVAAIAAGLLSFGVATVYHEACDWVEADSTRPIQGARKKVKTLLMVTKGTDHGFSTFPIVGVYGLTIFRIFGGLVIFCPRASKYRLCLAQPSLRLSLMVIIHIT